MTTNRWAAVGFVLLAFGIYKSYFSAQKIKSDVPYQLIYKETIVGPKTKAAIPMLILLHGSGGSETDWISKFSNFTQSLRIISFRGPGHKQLGYDWSPAVYAETQDKAEAKYYELMKKSAYSVARSVPELLEKYPTLGKPFLAGFSSGAMVSYFIAANEGASFRAIFPVSGKLIDQPLAKTNLNNLVPVFAYHGTEDTVIGISAGRSAIETLRTAGHEATLTEFKGGHTFSVTTAQAILLKITILSH